MKCTSQYYLIKSTVLIIIGFLSGCGIYHSDQRKMIARIGNRIIDRKMLNQSFELNPKWGKGLTNEQAYFNQLNYLIDEKLFAQAAEKDGMDKDSVLSRYLSFIKQKEVIKGLYTKMIASKVEISEKEYQQGYEKLKRKVVLNYIFTPNYQHALEYLNAWQTSEFENVKLIDESLELKGQTQPYSFGDMQPELDNVVFDLKQNEISNPIPIDNGYMIVQLVSGSIDLFMSETDFAENKNRIRKVIYDRKAGKIANSYIKNMMKDKNLKLNPPIFYALSNELSKIVKNKYSEDPLPIYINDQEINTTQNHLQEILPEVLITYKDGQMTAGDFLMNLNGMPPNLRPRVNMAPQLKNAIGVMVRNKFLAKQAMEMGLEKNPEVIREIEIQSDQLLAKYWLLTKEKEIEVSEREIEDFKISKRFEELKQRLGDTPTSEQIRDILIDYKFQIEKMKLSESMRNQLPVKIDSLELQRNIKKPDQKIKNDPIRFVYRELFN
jgi:peptidyl-prolyl cis-trans isomerase C